MHRILDHYERLPDNANDRAALYANLTILVRDLPTEATQSIEAWLTDGGEFPFARPIRPSSPESRHHGLAGWNQRGGDDMDDDMDI